MFGEFRYRLGYESLCAEVSDSIFWRRFCRIPLDATVPHPTTLMKLTTRCGAGAVAGLNEALLARAVGKMVRAARRVQAAGGAADTVMTDRRRAAAWRVRRIAARLRSRAKGAGEESSTAIARVTGELACLAEKTAAQACAVLRNGRRALPKAIGGRVRGRLRRALDELAVTLERTATIVAQTRSRLAGQMPDSATRLVSLHDPDARPIRKGRIDKPVEFGYKAQVIDNDDGIVVDYGVEYGAAPDGPQLVPAIERVARRAGRVPRAVTADRGYGQAAVERDLHAAGVRTVAIPRQATTSPARKALEHGRASAGWSSGAPAAKDEWATSSADTAGTGPAWTARTGPPSGADTGYSPTTWSRSAPWPADPAPAFPRRQAGPSPHSAFRLFQVEVASGIGRPEPGAPCRRRPGLAPGMTGATGRAVMAALLHRRRREPRWPRASPENACSSSAV